MTEGHEEHKSESEKEKELIHLFTAQLKGLKKITETDQSNKQYKSRAAEIKNTALTILNQIEEQKQKILKKMDNSVLLPAANEIVDGLSRFTDDLRQYLEKNLKENELTEQVNWREQATLWAQLYAKWHDQKAIEDNIVQYLAMRSSELIAKDLQVIDEYQNRTLSELNMEEEELESLKKRLEKVIEDPLKEMQKLKNPPSDVSLEKIGEWISSIQEQREHHFDSLLMRIESVVGDVQQFSDYFPDPIVDEEVRHSMASLEMELKEIEMFLMSPQNLDEKKLSEVRSHLESLEEDAIELLEGPCSQELRVSLELLLQKISSTIASLPLSH